MPVPVLLTTGVRITFYLWKVPLEVGMHGALGRLAYICMFGLCTLAAVFPVLPGSALLPWHADRFS